MRKLILGIALAATVLASSAKADGWNRRNNGGGGGDAGIALFGGLVGGMILGGMMNQNQGYNQPQYQQQYQPVCQRVFAGSFWNGWQWVPRYQVICQ